MAEGPLTEIIRQRQEAQRISSGGLPQSAIEGAQMAAAELSTPQRLLVGLGKGASNIVEGLGQLTGLSSAQRQARVSDDRALFEAGLGDDIAAGAGEIAGEIGIAAPLALVPGGALAASGLGRVGLSSAVGAAEGAAGFVDEGQSRAANAGLGLVGGAAAGGLIEGAGRLANAVRGRAASAQQQEILDLGEQFNVPVSGADVSTSMNIRRADVLAENVPLLGPANFRLGQAEAAREAAEGLRGRLAIPDVESVGNEIQRGIRARSDRLTQIANRRFDRVRELAAQQGGDVQPTDMQAAIRTIIADEETVPALEPAITSAIARLGDIQTAPFERFMQLRSRLQTRVNQLYDGGNRNAGRVLSQVVRGLESDMGRVAQERGGRLAREWQSARDFFRTQVVPQRARAINEAAKKETPDTIFRQFLRGASQVDKPQQLYRALDNRGRQAVRFGIVDEALQKATNTGRPGNPVFSPAKFAGELERLQGATGVFFRGRERQEIEGMTKLMRAIQRAGEVAENPPTGQRLVLPALGASFFDLGATAFSTLASTAGIRALTTTAAGRRLLIASSNVELGTPAMDRILRRAAALAASASSQQAANTPQQ